MLQQKIVHSLYNLLCFLSLGTGTLTSLFPRLPCQVAVDESCQWEPLAGDVRCQEKISHFSFSASGSFLGSSSSSKCMWAQGFLLLKHGFRGGHTSVNSGSLCSASTGNCGMAADCSLLSYWFSAGSSVLYSQWSCSMGGCSGNPSCNACGLQVTAFSPLILYSA